MSAVILAVLDRAETADRVLAAAGCLSELTGAGRVNGLAVRRRPIDTIMPTEQILTPEYASHVRADEQRRADALKAMFDAWGEAQQRGLATAWSDVEGRAAEVVADFGRRADFVVLKRPAPHDPDPDRQAVHAALFETDRPILMVPAETAPAPFGRTVAIAWRNDERTVKAVLAALRCLKRAERIHVLAGAREGAPEPRMPDIFEEHGIAAELHVLPITGQGVFGAALLARAHALACDMLVMGAFARHPLRSLILGGVTRHMLAHADLPVFMRH
ncbi:MAG TPA: universal stress protein [Acidisphaera sp.]|nr:universal stress protein [Acidisphaera sp.]